MKVYDLDGNESQLNLAGYLVNLNDSRPRSEYHKDTRTLLKTKYPLYTVAEEVPIKIKRGETLYLDFLIPQLRICIEVHGEQHFKFVQHFHKTMQNFLQHKKRDKLKREWLEINNIRLVEFNYNESQDEWLTKLQIQKQ